MQRRCEETGSLSMNSGNKDCGHQQREKTRSTSGLISPVITLHNKSMIFTATCSSEARVRCCCRWPLLLLMPSQATRLPLYPVARSLSLSPDCDSILRIRNNLPEIQSQLSLPLSRPSLLLPSSLAARLSQGSESCWRLRKEGKGRGVKDEKER